MFPHAGQMISLSPPTDYVAFYKFENLLGTDEEGTHTFDTITGGITNVTGIKDDGIFIPYADYLRSNTNPFVTGDLAVSFHHKTSRNSTANERVLNDVDNASAYAAAFELIQTSSNFLQFRRGNNINAEATFFTDNLAINDNTWRHIVINVSGALASLYLDGVLAASGSASPTIVASTRMALGHTTSLVSGTQSELSIDHLKIYNRALTLAEIQSLHLE